MNKQKGFTIIELIVVIAIIAILAAIVLVNVSGYINKAKDARVTSNISNLALSMSTCYADNAAAGTATYVGCYASAPSALKTDTSTANGGTAIFTTEAASTYVLCAKMASSASGVCIDASGVTKTVATFSAGCTGTITVCP